MNNFDIKIPNVLGCNYFTSRNISFEQSKRTVANYELDFNISSGRIMKVNGKAYKIEKNSISFRKPGDIAQSEGLYNMYALTFSFDKTIKNYDRNNSPQSPSAHIDITWLNNLPAYIKPYHSGEIVKIYRNILSVFGREDCEYSCSQLTAKLLYLLASEQINIKTPKISQIDKVNDAITYISEHYGEPITLEMIADYVHFDKSYLTRCFKKSIGKTPIDYLIDERLSMAKMLLEDTDLSISKISSLCGFSYPSYFTFRFRRDMGISPGEFRKSL